MMLAWQARTPRCSSSIRRWIRRCPWSGRWDSAAAQDRRCRSYRRAEGDGLRRKTPGPVLPRPECRAGKVELIELSVSRALLVAAVAIAASAAASGAARWMEAVLPVSLGLIAFVVGAALLAGVVVGRSASRRQASSHYMRTRGISGRNAGALAGAATLAAAAAATLLIPPRSWPSSVDGAVTAAMAVIEDAELKSIAYLGKEDLASMHFGLGLWIRNNFGLWGGNWRLMSDCGESHPDSCSGVIIDRLWNRLRSELPGAERAGLELLEEQMARVSPLRLDFHEAGALDVAAAINDAVARDLPGPDRFVVRVDPELAGQRISWTDPDESEFPFALTRLGANTSITIRKAPPDLVLEPDLWPMAPHLPQGTLLEPLLAVEHGLRQELHQVVTDEAAWSRLWRELDTAARLGRPLPSVDFSRSTVLIVALGRRPGPGYRVKVQAASFWEGVRGYEC